VANNIIQICDTLAASCSVALTKDPRRGSFELVAQKGLLKETVWKHGSVADFPSAKELQAIIERLLKPSVAST
ncbi:MAG: hypothetical protein SGCHY_002365, partial [Lobulomycetales sp.]